MAMTIASTQSSAAAPAIGGASFAGGAIETGSHLQGVDTLAARLKRHAQDVRVHHLEKHHEKIREHHAGQIEDFAAQLSACKNEILELNSELAWRDKELVTAEKSIAELRATLAGREALLVERTKEVSHLRALLDQQTGDSHAQRAQLTLLTSQLRKTDEDLNVARYEKERCVGPVQQQKQQLERDLETKSRQARILQQEVAMRGMEVEQLQANAASQQDKANKAQAAAGAELAFREARIRHLEAMLEAQDAEHKDSERRLSDRCRLLQAWCFRTWWSLEAAGSNSFPGLMAEDSVPNDGRHVRVAGKQEASVPLKAPMPSDWRSVLRFQASLFHWLAAETIRLKAAQLQGRKHELELPFPKDGDGALRRERSGSRRRR